MEEKLIINTCIITISYCVAKGKQLKKLKHQWKAATVVGSVHSAVHKAEVGRAVKHRFKTSLGKYRDPFSKRNKRLVKDDL